MINGRVYEPAEMVQPPGQRRPDPILLHWEARRADSAPHPPTTSDEEDHYGFDESDELVAWPHITIIKLLKSSCGRRDRKNKGN